MLLRRKDVMRMVEKGEGNAEVLKVELVMKNGKKRHFVVVYSRAPFSARIRWMNAVTQIKFALIEQSNQYEKNYLVQWV